MRYIDIAGYVIPKHCIYGPRPAEGVVFNSSEWWRITDHLVREQRGREIAAISKAKEEYKKDFSFGMTSKWNNTLASIKTQGNQKRLEKVEKEKQDKIDEYNDILEGRKEERRLFVEKMKRSLFQETEAAKIINPAVLDATVRDELERQVEMKNIFRQKEIQKEREYFLKIKKDVEDWEREQCQEQLNARARMKQQFNEEMEAIRLKKQAQAEEFEVEKEDLLNMLLEGERIHQCNLMEKEYQKRFAEKYMRKTDDQIEFQRNLALEEEEECEINQIYLDYAERFAKQRKETEEKMKSELLERRKKISEYLEKKMAEDEARRTEYFLAAAREKEDKERKEEEEEKEKQRLAVESILAGKRDAEERKAREQYMEKERKKWELMQRYKGLEKYEEWKLSEEKHKIELQKRYKAGIDCQCRQNELKRAQELKEQREPLVNEELEKQDVMQYIDETMKFIKDNNLPEYRVKLAIAQVKKEYGIIDKEQQELLLKRKQQEMERQECRKTKFVENGCYCLK